MRKPNKHPVHDEKSVMEIAVAHGLKAGTAQRFARFVLSRFPDESKEIKSYFGEWATRFQRGHPEVYMDYESERIYDLEVGL